MSDEWSETDEWPLPRYTGSSKVPATFHPSETPTVARGPEWRDRGLIIAQQQTRIAQLEREVGRLRDRVAYLTPFGSDFECCASGSCEVCRPGSGWTS